MFILLAVRFKRILAMTLIISLSNCYTYAKSICDDLFYQHNLTKTQNQLDAAEFIKKVEQNFLLKFKNSVGKTYDEFILELRQSNDPIVHQAIKLVENNQFEVIIVAPSSVRSSIQNSGIKNQFATGYSHGGIFNLQYRNKAESILFGVESEQQYQHRPPDFKPKYGILRPTKNSKISTNLTKIIKQYGSDVGSDVYVLKLENIEDRITFFMDDSLRYGVNEDKVPDPFIGMRTKIKTAWDGYFIPWKFRMIMVPFLIADLIDHKMERPTPHNMLKIFNSKPTPGAYWEVQILGEINPEDIKEINSFN